MDYASQPIGLNVNPAGTIFASGNVSISRTLIKVGNASHPVSAVSSVVVQAPSARGAGIKRRLGKLLLGLAAIDLVGVAIAATQIGIQGSWAIAAPVVAFGLIGYMLYRSPVANKPYKLIVRTANGDQELINSKDMEMVFAAQKAIEQAIAERG